VSGGGAEAFLLATKWPFAFEFFVSFAVAIVVFAVTFGFGGFVVGTVVAGGAGLECAIDTLLSAALTNASCERTERAKDAIIDLSIAIVVFVVARFGLGRRVGNARKRTVLALSCAGFALALFGGIGACSTATGVIFVGLSIAIIVDFVAGLCGRANLSDTASPGSF
jgi:hypothetical protein